LIFFCTAFLKFYFRPNGLNNSLFVIPFAIKKILLVQSIALQVLIILTLALYSAAVSCWPKPFNAAASTAGLGRLTSHMYKALVKPALFNLDAERAHHFVFDNLRRAARVPGAKAMLRGLYDFQHPCLAREVFGLKFPNPVGLAAGFDKNAALTDELATLGFGFVAVAEL
jgi:hypothetical protein